MSKTSSPPSPGDAKKQVPDPPIRIAKQGYWLQHYLDPVEWDVLYLSTIFKLALFPAYRSTDFEVHRNWLAITFSLPISQWYYDTTSQWTLDYPPFFAYFEKLLSIPAYLFDSRIVDINNLNYSAWTVIVYQRATVVLSDLVLAAALSRFTRGVGNTSTQRILVASLFLHPGFMILDHIHFQYNGFLYGILLWSILMAREGNKLASGVLFAVLLNFKHLYIYLAPAYFVFLLRTFCISPSGQIQPAKFLSLANAVIAVFVLSFGPFILMGQLPQVLSRLFPFTRGLNHAYWAANFWAIVTAMDRVLLQYVKRAGLNISINEAGIASSSRGLVGDTVFAVLPNVKPVHTFIITAVMQSIFLIKLWLTPTYKSFLTALTLCGYASFMFGWHVHEKAILMVLVPFTLLAAEKQSYFRTYMIASVAGVYSLFPLIFTPAESIIKILYSVLWAVFVYETLNRRVYEFPPSLPYVIIDVLEKIYLAGFPTMHIFNALFPVLFRKYVSATALRACLPADTASCVDPQVSATVPGEATAEFFPLMLTSVYCAVGLMWAFLIYNLCTCTVQAPRLAICLYFRAFALVCPLTDHSPRARFFRLPSRL